MCSNGDGVVNWREVVIAAGLRSTDVPLPDLFALAFEVLDAVKQRAAPHPTPPLPSFVCTQWGCSLAAARTIPSLPSIYGLSHWLESEFAYPIVHVRTDWFCRTTTADYLATSFGVCCR
jgi:hypothetical protein